MSQTASITVTDAMLRHKGTVSIHVSDGQRRISAGDIITPAEFVAVTQVVSGQAQTLSIDSLGRATGGTFQVDSPPA